jgi:integrase/recombinase XerD
MTVLRQRMAEDMQIRNLSPLTQSSYLQQISSFARHFDKSPALLGPDDIRSYQVFLTNEKKLAPKSVHVCVSALRFFYKVTLKKDWEFDEVIPTPRPPKTLPIVLRARREIIESGQWQERRNRIAVWFGATRSRMAFSPM